MVRDVYRELRYERGMGGIQALTTTWQLCTRETELIRLCSRDVTVLHPLGPWSGSSLWMQEVVNRFLYPAINAFVYAGAAVLLVAVGLTRMDVIRQPWLVVAGIAVEALLLIALFVVMYFTPPEEADGAGDGSLVGSGSEELLRELGEIGRDYAAMAVQLESISGTLADVATQQRELIQAVQASVDAAVSAVAPNLELQRSMKDTADALRDFAAGVSVLSDRLQEVERQEVERLVRSELEHILSRSIQQSHATPPPTS